MIEHISTSVKPLTKELAREVSKMPGYKGERPLRRGRVEFLRSRLDEGFFYPPRWSFVRIGDTTYRANGQHSSFMLSESDGNFPKSLNVIIDEFNASSLLDVADLFGQFDNRKCTRTPMELVNAHARVHGELDQMSPTRLAASVAGIAYGMCDGRVGIGDAEWRARLTHQHTRFILWADEFLATRFMSRAPVVGAMFRTYGIDQADALVFWHYVRDENHPDRRHASRMLADFLRDNQIGEGKSFWGARAFYVKAIHGWNAYRRKATTNLKYTALAGIPTIV